MYILKTLFFSAPGNHPNRCPSLSYTSRHPTSTRWVPMPKVEQPTPPGQRESPTRSKDPWPRGLGLHGECNFEHFLEFGTWNNWSLPPQKKIQDFSSPSTGTPHRRFHRLSWHHPPHPQYFPQRWRPWRHPRWNQRVQQWHLPNRPHFFHVLFWWKKPWIFPWRIPESGWKYLEIWGTNIWCTDILIDRHIFIYTYMSDGCVFMTISAPFLLVSWRFVGCWFCWCFLWALSVRVESNSIMMSILSDNFGLYGM